MAVARVEALVVALAEMKVQMQQAEVMVETQRKPEELGSIDLDTAKEQLPDILENLMVNYFLAVAAVTIMAPVARAEVQTVSMGQRLPQMLSVLTQLLMALVAVRQKLIQLGNAPKAVRAIKGFLQ